MKTRPNGDDVNWLIPAFFGIRRLYLGIRDEFQYRDSSNRKPVQADFDEIAATVVRNRAEAKTKGFSAKEVLERDRSRSSEDRLIYEHLPELMLSLGAAQLPDMSIEAVFAWASHVKSDPLIQSSDASKILEREIAAYAKFGWVISEEPFEGAGNLSYLGTRCWHECSHGGV